MESHILQNTINNVMKPSNEEAMNKLMNSNLLSAAGNGTSDKNNNKPAEFEIRGYDLNNGIDYEKIFKSYMNTGFQATNLTKAIKEINRMIKCKQQELPEEKKNTSTKTNCTIFLGYTSNMISSGIREYIRYLVQHKMVNKSF